ncbi:unnamed protein product, partial [Mesorhabditis spiculigera]
MGKSKKKAKVQPVKPIELSEGELSDDSCEIVEPAEPTIDPEILVCEQYDNFVVDRVETQEHETAYEAEKHDSKDWSSDIYSKLLSHASVDTPPSAKQNKTPKASCWNCDGPHNMNACPERRNQRKINEARRQFQDSRRSQESLGRYHADEKEGESGGPSKFRVGRIGNELRRALGIGENDLPEYIYRMRRMGFIRGYPPAYLKQALTRQSSGDDTLHFHTDEPSLTVFNKKIVPRPNSIDDKKLFYYAGFNMHFPRLNDHEAHVFTIPPWETWVEMHTQAQIKVFEEEEARRAKEEAQASRKRKATPDATPTAPEKSRKLDGDDSLIFVDREPTTGTPMEQGGQATGSTEDTSVTPKATRIRGRSSGVSIGTPVARLTCSQTGADAEKEVPDLQCFTKGIVEFSMEEDQPSEKKGFFKRMFAQIKEKYTTQPE